MLVARSVSSNTLVRLLPAPVNAPAWDQTHRNPLPILAEHWPTEVQSPIPSFPLHNVALPPVTRPSFSEAEVDPLYLLACHMKWQKSADPSAAWDVISSSRSSHEATRAHARALLEHIEQPSLENKDSSPAAHTGADLTLREEATPPPANNSRTRMPYGLNVIESCTTCKISREGAFCRFSPSVLRSVDAESFHSVTPSGTLLFVEGQAPRGVYIICSGKVKLFTTSRDGKVLILKQAEAGGILGLSASITGTNYEMTAETTTHCQLNFIGRRDLIKLLQTESELGVRSAQALSREFQGAYSDIHDLLLARSSSGKLAKLLLSRIPKGASASGEMRLRIPMTHEEMAQRIGSSRETVTRLLSSLKKKRLIRIEGATLIIRSRSALESLAS